MYLVKTPQIIQKIFPDFVWRMPSREKTLYLTFDDGPIPVVTPWVLKTLRLYHAKATFFCVGDNVRKHPNIFEAILKEDHTVGNHTFHHLDGWKTNKQNYLENVEKCETLINSNLFRPPYGHLRPNQAKALNQKYKIVMWDVLSGDFDPNLSFENCLENVLSNAKSGSVIVFHDSLKAEEKLRYVLPKTLEHFREKGYLFNKI